MAAKSLIPKNKEFTIIVDDIQKQIDVDDSRGRSVPINMNFIEEGFLTKDSGFVIFGDSPSEIRHSLFHYKKKNGTSYILGVKGTSMQRYIELDKQWIDLPGSPVFTEGAEFGYGVYDDNLYFGNAVESYYKFDGSDFTEYGSAPKGNIIEVFEDRVFVSGVTAEPLSIYYSDIATPTTFNGSSVVKPLGTDTVTNLKNYYGTLMIFKKETITKLTFVFDQVASLFVPKLEVQSGNYGACGRKAVAWVENDLWFFTGREVRSIGFKDQQTGVFGVNNSVISDNIKETLKTIDKANFSNCVCAYDNRRFYLAIPLDADTNDTVFVCHLLYNKSWTKYTGRTKSKVNDFMFIDDITYTSSSSSPYGVIKWTVEDSDIEDINNALALE